jgi:hypothetical protein
LREAQKQGADGPETLIHVEKTRNQPCHPFPFNKAKKKGPDNVCTRIPSPQEILLSSTTTCPHYFQETHMKCCVSKEK